MTIAHPLRYPRVYPWFVLLAALDVALTWMLLGLGGREANAVAAMVISGAGLAGAVALKTFSVLTVLLICEVVGRRSDPAGRRLALASVGLSGVPVAVGAFALLEYAVMFQVYL